jgi:hypothetical protein
MQFGIHLVRRGLLSAADFVDVIEQQLLSRPPLGELAIETHALTMKQLFQVLAAQVDVQRPFGAMAFELGYLQLEDVERLLGLQCERSRSLSELVIEMGLLDAETVERERRGYYLTASSATSTVDARGEVIPSL